MKDKTVFDVTKLNSEGYARSLGLINAPRVRFIQKKEKLSQNASNEQEYIELFPKNDKKDDSDHNDEEVYEKEDKPKSKVDTAAYNFGYDVDSDDDKDPLFTVKSKFIPNEAETVDDTKFESIKTVSNKEKKRLEKPVTKAAVVKKLKNKNIVASRKIVFDEDGEAVDDVMKRPVSEFAKSLEIMGESGIDIETAKLAMKEEDKIDKETYRQKLKAARIAKKVAMKKKLLKQQEEEEEYMEDAGNDDWSSGDENSVDLDFLPDPDKVYKNKDTNEDVGNDQSGNEEESSENYSEESSESSEDEEVEETVSKKRKLDNSKLQPNKKRVTSKEKISSACKDFSLQDTEMLALKLLEKKNT
ncbi:hypothetical protein CHUAL_002805 [Chamberlinius hualienensis]